MTHSVYSLVLNHVSARPRMQVADVYKLLYQSCMGLGHLLSDQEAAFSRLEEEMSSLQPYSACEYLMEDITLDHPLVRVNLRPFIQAGLNAEMLLSAMLETERAFPPSRNKLIQAWEEYCILESQQAFPSQRSELERFQINLQNQGYPVQHHSPVYRNSYFPAYRIVDHGACLKMLSAYKGFSN